MSFLRVLCVTFLRVLFTTVCFAYDCAFLFYFVCATARACFCLLVFEGVLSVSSRGARTLGPNNRCLDYQSMPVSLLIWPIFSSEKVNILLLPVMLDPQAMPQMLPSSVT